MSNFADMAYDNYLMHYRTKGSKNGYTKDPDYTPVGEKAVAKKVMRDKLDKLAEENKVKYQYYNYRWAPGFDPNWEDIEKSRKRREEQASRGDYAGMPSSALAAKERTNEISRLSKRASSGDYSGMPTSSKEAQARVKEERNKKILRKYEINQLSKQASRGDLGGMPSSARASKEKMERASEIDRLSKQKTRGDYAGMPSSALMAKERANGIRERARVERANAERRNEINMRSGQARRGDYAGMSSSIKEAQERAKRASEISRLSKQKTRGDYAGMPSSVKEAQARAKEEKRDRMKANAEAKRKAEYMKAKAEAKRLNSPYEQYNNREKSRKRNKAEKSNRDDGVKDWEDIARLNKSNSALKSTLGYESRSAKENRQTSELPDEERPSYKAWHDKLKENAKKYSPLLNDKDINEETLKKYNLWLPYSTGKGRKV